MADARRFSEIRRKPSIGRIVLIVLLHIVALYALAKALAPDFTASVEQGVVSTFSVTVTTPDDDPPPPENEPEPDEGAQGDPGKQAVPKPVTAEEPKVRLKEDKSVPKASSTGTQDTSGARNAGDGTGAAGEGRGTGSGNSGAGQGGVAMTKPVKIAGDINAARDFPTPPGGRQVRWGKEVIVFMTVGTDGRASNCRVQRSSVEPEAGEIVCRLAVERFRFRPATDSNGNPVPSTYGWRQWWAPAGE